MNITGSGSVLRGIGMVLFVVAISVFAIGSGGYAYMGINPDAVQLVAGCALLGATLLAAGIIFSVCGLGARLDAVSEAVKSIEERLDEQRRVHEIEGDVRDVLRLIEERNDVVMRSIRGEALDSSAIGSRTVVIPARLTAER